MKIHHLIIREIWFSRFSSLLIMASIIVAIAVALGAYGVVQHYQQATDLVMMDADKQAKARWTSYENQTRKMMKKLGFNIMVTHQEHSISNPVEEAKFLPQSYADTLSNSKLITINHLLPFIEQKYHWAEKDKWVTLVGTNGQSFIAKSWQKPIFKDVPGGKAVLGYEVHKHLNLKVGDKITIGGRDFLVHRTMAPQGFADDEKVWIALPEAQRLLGQPDKITGILALNCKCADNDVGMIRAEIGELLEGVSVKEHHSKMVTRAEARRKETEKAVAEIQNAAVLKQNLQVRRSEMASLLVPLVLCSAVVWLSVQGWLNVRRRRHEIGILRAMGLATSDVLVLILGKSSMLGILGGVFAVLLTMLGLWMYWGQWLAVGEAMQWWMWFMAVVGGVIIGMLSSIIPAYQATLLKPALLLKAED